MDLSQIHRPIWPSGDNRGIQVIDQRKLPHQQVIADLFTVSDICTAIQEMYVRGAPLIGATGAYGMWIAAQDAAGTPNPTAALDTDAQTIKSARPTAVNLAWAVDRMQQVLAKVSPEEWNAVARAEADRITEEEADNCRKIGANGLTLIREIADQKHGAPVNILTHCNAGWLACIEFGTATAPIYAAHAAGIPVHVWVDETRPLNQGARLTAWELGRSGVAHTLITDNAGGHLMQHGQVDLVIVGTDRTTYTGDVANKIGTYLKALAANDNGIPFYVALPSSTFDWTLESGMQIPIEERQPDEVHEIYGRMGVETGMVRISPEATPAANPAFDVTPARLVSGFITERGICRADAASVLAMFPEKRHEKG
ncbi:MAG: S-methyl-5-thioribose-1-phosphate isomerase [Deltaproteobacteria bacterium]|nr:MAG: S-methyl-5-thioribose-1-phosphate isomerase [Deltaproteobacteria bacterium]